MVFNCGDIVLAQDDGVDVMQNLQTFLVQRCELDESAVESIEHAQLELHSKWIENSSVDFSASNYATRSVHLKGVITDSVSDCNVSIGDSEILTYENSSSDECAFVEITDLMQVRKTTNRLLCEFNYLESSGDWNFLCRFFDIEKKAIGIDLPFVSDNKFFVHVPKAANQVSISLKMMPNSMVALSQTMAVTGLVITDEPLTSSNLPMQQNGISAAFLRDYDQLISLLPESNGTRYYEKYAKKRIGIITDDLMYNYYAQALDLVYLTPESYLYQLETENLDAVLYVSCWLGLREPEGDRGYDYRPDTATKLVPEIFREAQKRGILSIFQTIEDPPSYNLFLPIARQADVIFTSAVESIKEYVKDTGNPNVHLLRYGINPLIHNPIGFLKKRTWENNYHDNCFFFAGSWYANFPERCKDSVLLLDTTIRHFKKQPIIADRTLEYLPPLKRRPFPQAYSEFIFPPIEHKKLQKVHKLFDACINLNTIKESETMGAMRVFELQALGNLLVSNYSKSLVNMFPETCIVNDDGSVSNDISKLTEREIVYKQVQGIRRIFSSETVYDRLDEILIRSGVNHRAYSQTVAVVVAQIADLTRAAFEKQTYLDKYLVTKDEALQRNDIGFFTLFNGDENNPFMLEDAMNAFKFVDVDYINFTSFGDLEHAYDYASIPLEKIEKTVFSSKNIKLKELLDSECSISSLSGFTVLDFFQ